MGITQMEQRGLKQRREVTLVKGKTLFTQKEGENYKTPPDALADLSIMIICVDKPQAIQAITMWSLRLNDVPYYRQKLSAATILDYFFDVDILFMLEDTQKHLLHGKPKKYEDILIVQYM